MNMHEGEIWLYSVRSFPQVWVWTHLLGPDRWWWTMPRKGEVRGNSDGGSYRYWRANRSSYYMFNLHPKLNIGSRPVANKYHERKTKRTLERRRKCMKLWKRGSRWNQCILVRLLRAKSGCAWCFLPCVSTSVWSRGKLKGPCLFRSRSASHLVDFWVNEI